MFTLFVALHSFVPLIIFYLGLFSACRMSCDISFGVGLLLINLSENVFMSGLFLKVIFTGYRILGHSYLSTSEVFHCVSSFFF